MFVTAVAAFTWANLNPANYLGGVSFRPDRDIPDLEGKVVLVTGGKFYIASRTCARELTLVRKYWSWKGDDSTDHPT
jgi:hypothetical protein